jgi:uncharacterized damage-inducible protein DinB
MAEAQTRLARFYEGCPEYQRLLVKAVAPLTGEQLALGAAPGLNPVWYLAAHIASCRVIWFERLGESVESLAHVRTWDDGDASALQPRTAAELATTLAATWDVVAGCLDRWTPERLDERFEWTRRSGQNVARTRGWVLWHVLEHDLHHGGEISLTLGAHGLPGINI